MKAGMRYAEFLAEKSRTVPASGFDVPAAEINEMLFGFQRDMTRWALRKGRAAIAGANEWTWQAEEAEGDVAARHALVRLAEVRAALKETEGKDG